jgi:hypothetical protein
VHPIGTGGCFPQRRPAFERVIGPPSIAQARLPKVHERIPESKVDPVDIKSMPREQLSQYVGGEMVQVIRQGPTSPAVAMPMAVEAGHIWDTDHDHASWIK